MALALSPGQPWARKYKDLADAEIQPEQNQAMGASADALMKKGELFKALALYKERSALDPANIQYKKDLGFSLLQSADAISKSYPDAGLHLARVARRVGREISKLGGGNDVLDAAGKLLKSTP